VNRLLGPPLSPSRRSQYSERTVNGAGSRWCLRILILISRIELGANQQMIGRGYQDDTFTPHLNRPTKGDR
jgi:hypothetical protein